MPEFSRHFLIAVSCTRTKVFELPRTVIVDERKEEKFQVACWWKRISLCDKKMFFWPPPGRMAKISHEWLVRNSKQTLFRWLFTSLNMPATWMDGKVVQMKRKRLKLAITQSLPFLQTKLVLDLFYRLQTSIEIFSKQQFVPGTCGLFTLERGVIV